MEEENKIEEQPSVEGSSEPADNVVEKDEESKAERGVPIGKFRNVDDLYHAYNNLQAEFTKKCQRLSELEKDKTSETKAQEEKLDAEFKMFLLENKDAFSYADEIKNLVLQDEALKADEKPFDKVWKKMVYEKMSSPNKAEEPIIQNLILNDDELKDLVIKNYVKELQKHNNPVIMPSGSGERVTKPVTQKPESFEEAKKVVLDLLS
ncbi:MAG: hypothetical protein IJ817_01740 [Clostridia bacterium]|nr:hypothetical protein [Clostridia bacterium]